MLFGARDQRFRPDTPLAQKLERAKLNRHFDRLNRPIAIQKPGLEL
jgi:hypothetical protein